MFTPTPPPPATPPTTESSSTPTASRRRSWARSTIGSLRTLGWIVAAALAAVVGSERIFWYWGGIDPESLGVLAGFYGVAIAVAVMVLASSPGTGVRRTIIAGALFGLVVEGIITPVVYEDGPLPLLFAMFVGWHGVFAFTGLVYLVRRWALEQRTLRLAVVSTVVGVGWGIWALASAIADRGTAAEIEAAGGGSAAVLGPREFAVYAMWTGLALIVAHVMLDRLWPRAGWRPSRAGRIATALAVAFMAATLVIPAVPWAPLKFAALAWMLWWMLRRTAAPAGWPTVVDELAGRIRLSTLAPLAIMPLAAGLTYLALWPTREFEVAMGSIYWGIVAVKVVVGVVALGWAARRRVVRTDGTRRRLVRAA